MLGAQAVDDLLRVLQVVNAALVIVGAIVGVVLIPWGKRYFASRNAPKALERLIREELGEMDARLRQDLNTGLSSSSAHSIQQYGSISTQLQDIKRSMDSAMERANEAHDRATAAVHKAERADDKISALDRLLTTRLDQFSSQMRGIEELLKHATVTARSGRGA